MPDTHAPQLEPWQWAEAQWRKLVGQVRAGKPYRPKAWKDGARCAIALSFDSDHETNELRDGGKSIGRMSWGQFGARVGVPRIRRLLARHGVKATFYVPAVAALLYPEEQRGLVAEGHEIGIHGWIHELNSVLPYEAERDLMLRSADTLEKITGRRSVGMRTPSWDFSPNTLAHREGDGAVLRLLVDGRRGLLRAHAARRGHGHRRAAGRMGARRRGLFLHAPLLLAPALHAADRRAGDLPPRLDAAWEDGGVFQLTMHPHIIGQRSRIWIVEELIRHAKSKGKRVVRHP